MRLKIISDGNLYNTKVVDADTDEELQFVTEVWWHLSVDDPVGKALIMVREVEVEVTGDGDTKRVFYNPLSRWQFLWRRIKGVIA